MSKLSKQWMDLVLVSLVFLLLVSAYYYIIPPLEGFDSIVHYMYINHLGERRQLPLIDEEAAAVSYEMVAQPPLYHILAAVSTAGTPYELAQEYARRSDNPYFYKGLSQRLSVSLPDIPSEVKRAMGISRLVSVVGGYLAVAGTWLLVRELVPRRRTLAIAVACVVGLNPLFLFISATIRNDTWSVAAATITLWLVVRTAKQERFAARRWLLVGCVAGAASLTKYSAALIAFPALVVVACYAKRLGVRHLIYAGLLVLAGGLLTSGFWHVRNLVLYGEIVPFRQMSTVLPTLLRATPLSYAELWDQMDWLFYSYWGVFVSIFAPVEYYGVVKWFVIIGCLGVPVYLFLRRDVVKPDKWFVVLVCLAWIVPALVSVINWTRLIHFGEQARLFLIAAPALAILLVLGWQGFVPGRWYRGLHYAISLLFVVFALWPISTLAHSYAMPKSLSENTAYDREIMATFAGGMGVLGVDFPEGTTVVQGAELPLTVYFKAERVIAEDYSLFIHLIDGENDLYAFNGVPSEGRHPTRQWIPGEIFADPYKIVVNPDAPIPNNWLATLTLGFYDPEDGQRQPVFGRDGTPAGDRLTLGTIRILTEPLAVHPLSERPLAQWEEGIRLVSIDPQEDVVDGSFVAVLNWQTSSLIHHDYTVFLQVLGKNNEVLSQTDRQPVNGGIPTSTWQPGEIIQDRYELEVPTDDWDRIILGFYDSVSGQRLRVEHPAEGQDHFLVIENRNR